MKKALCIITLLFTLSFISAQDVTIVFQNNSQYSGCTDSYLHKQIDTTIYENTNYGNELNLDIYDCPTWAVTQPQIRAIIKFDLSTLPTNVQDIHIKNAELSLFNASKTRVREEGDSVAVKALTKPWVETEATWLKASSSQNWTTPGGDFESATIFKRTFSANEVWETYTVTGAIKIFVKTPSLNNGFIIAALMDFKGIMDTQTPHRQYVSSEFTDDITLRPKLSVTYNTSGINYFAPATLFGKSISVQINAERVKFFIPLKNSYTVVVSNIKGRQISSFKGNNEAWYQVPASMLSNGMHIISISTEDIKASAKFLFVK